MRASTMLAATLGATLVTASAVVDSRVRAQAVFRGGVDMVRVTATVTDGDGRFIGDLSKEDFVVLDEGRPQEILTFSRERVPVSLGILLDVSRSMTEVKMAAARVAVRRFIYDLLDPEDELFLAEFGGRAHLLQSWTTDRDAFSRALDRAAPQFGTALYDAVVRALPTASGGVHDKKALLILSDGDDTTSGTSVRRAQEAIRATEILVYALGIEDDVGVNAGALRKLTDDTGGRTEIVKGFRNLEAATAALADELDRQYQIGYAAPAEKDGRWHEIKIEVRRRGAKVRARAGYFAT